MDKKDWELLKTLSEVKSMSRAADLVFLSQPAIVYRINRMEQEMETSLFLRNSKGVQLTSAGSRLLSYANKMLLQNEQIKNFVSNPEETISGQICIGASTTIVSSILSQMLKGFVTQHLHISFSIQSWLNDELMRRLQQEELMIAIIRGDFPWDGGCIHMFQEPLAIIASQPITDALLIEAPFISFHRDSRFIKRINGWYQSLYGMQPRLGFNTNCGPANSIKLIKEGLGWTVVPMLHLKDTTGLYTKSVRDKNGEILLHPTRLLYYDYILEFDAYAAFISYVETYCADLQQQGDWQWNLKDDAE